MFTFCGVAFLLDVGLSSAPGLNRINGKRSWGLATAEEQLAFPMVPALTAGTEQLLALCPRYWWVNVYGIMRSSAS